MQKSATGYTLAANGPKGFKVAPQHSPELKTLLLDEQIIATLKVLANEKGNANPDDIKKLGQALYNALFIQPILLAFGKAQGSTISNKGVRLRLQIEPPELAALPWETLYDGQDWLSTKSSVPAVRKLILDADSKTLQSLQVRGALRILFVGASPEGLPNLKIKETAIDLQNLLAESIKKKQIVFNVLLNATLKELQQELVKDYHILYFAGHGSPEGIFLDDGEGEDLVEDQLLRRKPGDYYRVSAKQLTQALEGKPTRLIFLAACNTGTLPNENRLLEGFAQELAKQSKLPAIVAMQYFISDMQANLLTKQFFVGLAVGHPVDVALAEARKVLIRQGQVGRDVFAPVLYLQAEDGALLPKAKNWQAISLSIALLTVAIVAGAFARNDAINQKRVIAQKLAKQAELIRDTSGASLVKSLLLSLQSLKERPTEEGDQALRRSLALLPRSTICTANRDEIKAVSFSPDGKYFALMSFNKMVQILEAKNCHLLTSWIEDDKNFIDRPSSFNLLNITLSNDGKYIAIANGKLLRVREVRSHHKLADFTLEGIRHISISPDGKYVSAASKYIAHVWEIIHQRKIGIFHSGDDQPIEDIALSNEGKHLAGVVDLDEASGVFVWEVATHKETSLSHNAARQLSINFSQDGKYLVTTGDEPKLDGNRVGQVRIFKLNDLEQNVQWTEIAKWNQDEIPVKVVIGWRSESEGLEKFTYIATLGDTTKIWRIPISDGIFDSDRIQLISSIPSEHSLALAFSPNAEFLNIASGKLSTRSNKILQAWEVDRHRQILTIYRRKFNGEGFIGFNPDGQTLNIIESGELNKWNISNGKKVFSRPLDSSISDPRAVSPDGRFIAVDDLTDIYLVNMETAKKRKVLPRIEGIIGAISANGKKLAIKGEELVRLLETEKSQQITSFSPQKDLKIITFSLDGKFLATASGDTVNIWACGGDDCRKIQSISQDSKINSVALSNDGQYLAIASGYIVKILQVSNTQTVATIENDLDIKTVAFSWDGKYLATTSTQSGHINFPEDSIAKIWLIRLKDIVNEACSRLKPNLTLLEREQYLGGQSYEKACPNLL